MNIYVKNNLNGIIHRVGDDRHDSLIIEDGKLSYYNLQCGEGTRFGGYSFCDKNGNTDFDNDCYDNYYPIDLDSVEKELLIKKQNLEKVIDDLKLENSNLKHSIDEKNEIIGDLEEEKNFEYTASFYMSKCEKFEKVIQIIKPLIKVQKSTMLDNVYWAYFGGGFQGIELTKEQYELLKEVLE